jgi:CheY-like chemotaxis protein
MEALKRVLVIDDDPVVGKSIDRVLTPKGYAVIAASSGEDALAKLANETYDVVYTDIRMPGMDGLEVARRIKAVRPWLPVVIVTGYGTEANEAEARELGVTGFLHKPLSPEMIEGSASGAFPAVALVAPAPAQAVAQVVPQPAEARKAMSPARTVAMFFAAPFIGLAFVLVGPFVGLGMLAWMAWKAFAGRWAEPARVVRNVALFFAAPFIGLAYAVALPFVGMVMLVQAALRARAARHD